MGDRLGLNRRIDHDTLKVLGRQRPGRMRNPQALLQERRKPLLTQTLTPPCQRRPIERRFVLENLLAAELLIVRVLDPPCVQLLVRQGMHMLEDQQTRHQPDRQRRVAVGRSVDFAQPAIEKPPIDLLSQSNQRVAHIDHLLKRRSEQVLLAIIPRLRHPTLRAQNLAGIESQNRQNGNRKRSKTGP